MTEAARNPRFTGGERVLPAVTAAQGLGIHSSVRHPEALSDSPEAAVAGIEEERREGGVETMTKYLISFPSGAMQIPDGDLQAVSDASHAVVQEAKDAGVWVFGGGIDESVPPVLVAGNGAVTQGTYPETRQIEGGYAVLELPTRQAAVEWAAKLAVACRCAQELRAFGYDPAS
jgi:hypothetical protein